MRMKRKAIKKHPWLFRLDDSYTWCTYKSAYHFGTIINDRLVFENEWIWIDSGAITIKKHYAWDGCSYKWSILDLFVIGVPDGRLRYGLPITYHASLIHDALTQFRHELPITRKQATAIFSALLKESGFFWRHVYVLMVKMFGQRDGW